MSGCNRSCGFCGRCTEAWEQEEADTEESPDYFDLAVEQAKRYRDDVLAALNHDERT